MTQIEKNLNCAASINVVKASKESKATIIVTGISAKTGRMTVLTELALHTLANVTQIEPILILLHQSR
jgi:hypothetical protein